MKSSSSITTTTTITQDYLIGVLLEDDLETQEALPVLSSYLPQELEVDLVQSLRDDLLATMASSSSE